MNKTFGILFFIGLLSVNAQQENKVEEFIQVQKANKLETLKKIQELESEGVQISEESKNGIIRFDDSGIPIFPELFEEATNKSMNVDQIWSFSVNGTNYSLDGSTMHMYIWDGGNIRTTHQEFMNGTSSRVVNMDTAGFSTHSTAVAGMLGAAGVSAGSKGSAPNINIIGRDYNDFNIEIPAQTNAKVSNHSYGVPSGWSERSSAPPGANNPGAGFYFISDYTISQTEANWNGNYTPETKLWDDMAYLNNEHIMLKSVGNSQGEGPNGQTGNPYVWDGSQWSAPSGSIPVNNCANGYDCLPVESNAKNIITVGAIAHLSTADSRYTSPSDVVLAPFSSIGPRDDGGIKPDLVSVGWQVNVPTANANNISYTNGTGTSFSCPAVSGVVALLDEMYFVENGAYMTSDLAKAVLVNSAFECGLAPGPDYRFGWGLVNALDAATSIANDGVSSYVNEASLTANSTFELDIMADGSQALKATISWIDPSADPILNSLNDRTSRLVNDLDLRIVNVSNNQQELPWKLDPLNPSASAIKADNVVDNVEQVIIDAPSAGQVYKVIVSHKGTLLDNDGNTINSTPFGIVITGGSETMGTEDVNSQNVEFTVYPNPTTNKIFYKLQNPSDIKSLSIFDAQGKLVIYQSNSLNGEVDVNQLPAGVYQLLLHTEAGKSSKSFIKK